jgi:hypothetical protein
MIECKEKIKKYIVPCFIASPHVRKSQFSSKIPKLR